MRELTRENVTAKASYVSRSSSFDEFEAKRGDATCSRVLSAYREYKMIVRRDRIRIVTFLEEDLLGFKKFSSYCSNHARFM